LPTKIPREQVCLLYAGVAKFGDPSLSKLAGIVLLMTTCNNVLLQGHPRMIEVIAVVLQPKNKKGENYILPFFIPQIPWEK
jgi:NaMN:DMB phosphoribosyltransferase